MKIIKVEYWSVFEENGIHLCDYDHCYCKWVTFGYYSEDYDIEKIILKIMNDMQSWNMNNINISEITLNTSPIVSKEISDKYDITNKLNVKRSK